MRLGVVGVAGSGPAGFAAADRAARGAWLAAALPGAPSVVADVVVAHAAGSPSPHGTVLIAGTGAVAASVRDDEVARRADGHGWLLGDTGSGVWLGVQAARATLEALDGRGRTTGLTVDVLTELGALGSGGPLPADVGDRTTLAQRVIGIVDLMRPAELGRLAPLVSRAAEAGDPVAARISAAAVDGLMETLGAVHEGPAAGGVGVGAAVVLAGSVLLQPGPVRSGVRLGVLDRWGVEPHDAGDGAGGAATMALRRAGHPVTAGVHARLTAR